MFDIDSTPIDPELLDFTGKNNVGKSGGRGLIYSQERGRYIKPMIPRGKVRARERWMSWVVGRVFFFLLYVWWQGYQCANAAECWGGGYDILAVFVTGTMHCTSIGKGIPCLVYATF